MKPPDSDRERPRRVVTQQFFEIELRPDGIVWLVRTATPYDNVASLHIAYDEMLGAVDAWLLERRITARQVGTRRRTAMAWLFDVRNVRTHRNDDAFEKALQKRQADLVERSPVVAVLVKTAVGRAQMYRLRRAENQGDPEVFDAVDEALAWLAKAMAREFVDAPIHRRPV